MEGVLVGRDREMGLLAGALEQVAAGRSTSLVLGGEAGQGKSAVLGWAAGEARRRGFAVLRATGVEFEQQLAFGGLLTVLRPVLDRLDGLDVARATMLRASLGLAESDEADESDGRLLTVYAATLDLLSAVSDESPVLVAVDDVQWVDSASAGALLFAAHRCEVDRVGFVFAHRTGTPSLVERAAIDRLELPGLDRSAAVELLLLHGVAPGVGERCWRLTSGNPLALIEGARGLSPAERAGDAPLPPALPIGARLLDGFRDELAALPEPVRQALGVAALEADDDVHIVAAALARLGRGIDDLAVAEERGIVSMAGGRVAWRHPLVRSAVVGELGFGDRRRLHRALADAATAAGRHEPALWHLSESVAGPDDAVAARMAQGAEAARRRGSPGAAAAAFEQAARLATEPAAADEHLLAAADAHYVGGEHERAVALLTPRIGATDDVAMRARMAAVIGAAELWLSGPAAATTRYELNALLVRDTSPDLAAVLLVHAAAARLLALEIDGARVASTAAAAAADAGGDPGLVFATAANATLVDVFSGGGAEACDRLRPIGELAMAALEGRVEGAGVVAQLCAYALVISDQAPAGVELARQVVHQADATGLVGRATFARIVLVEGLWRLGLWADALAVMSQIVSVQVAAGLRELVPAMMAELSRIEAGLGQDGACREHAAQAIAAADALGMPEVAVMAKSALGLLELGAGRHAEAAAHFDEVARVAGHVPEPGWLWWQADAIEALAGCGRVADAGEALRRLRSQVTSTGPRWAPAAARRAGALLGWDDPPDDAYTAALDGFRAIDAPFEVARTLLLRGRQRLRDGRRAEGARDVAEARTAFDRLGARPWSDRASAVLGEAHRAAPTLAAQLTAAELRVAMSVGHGATNREAAGTLFLSRKTVDFHLQNIYRKLGVRNRTQLAALVLNDGPGG